MVCWSKTIANKLAFHSRILCFCQNDKNMDSKGSGWFGRLGLLLAYKYFYIFMPVKLFAQARTKNNSCIRMIANEKKLVLSTKFLFKFYSLQWMNWNLIAMAEWENPTTLKALKLRASPCPGCHTSIWATVITKGTFINNVTQRVEGFCFYQHKKRALNEQRDGDSMKSLCENKGKCLEPKLRISVRDNSLIP